MKKILSALVVLILFSVLSPVVAEAKGFLDGLGKIYERNKDDPIVQDQIQRQAELQRERDRLRQEKKERELQIKLDAEQQRQQMILDIENNRAEIQMEMERNEEIKRQEALRDLQFQQILEIETERQARERALRNAPLPSAEASTPASTTAQVVTEVRVKGDGSCFFFSQDGMTQEYRSIQELIESNPGQTFRFVK